MCCIIEFSAMRYASRITHHGGMPVDLIFKSHHQHLDEPFKAYAQRKLDRLARYLPTVQEAVLELRHEKTRSAEQRYVVQVTVNTNGTWLRAEERAAEPRTAVDLASDALGRQIRRHKDRVYRSGHTGHQRARATLRTPEPDAASDDDDDGLILGRVVREKRFPIQVMSVEEAVEQMELLGHNFFLFFDGDESRYALLYRRRDGDYGLIRPEK
jgi:ribosome hibernation promoting factor